MIEIVKSELVQPQQIITIDCITPASNQQVIINQFVANSPAGDKSFAELQWGSGSTYDTLWTIWGADSMPTSISLIGDGVKNLNLLLRNDDAQTAIKISAYVLIKEL